MLVVYIQVHTLYGKWEIMNWFRYPEIPYYIVDYQQFAYTTAQSGRILHHLLIFEIMGVLYGLIYAVNLQTSQLDLWKSSFATMQNPANSKSPKAKFQERTMIGLIRYLN